MHTERVKVGSAAARSRSAVADSTTLDVRLFGELVVRIDGAPLPALDSARAESLFAYLLLHRDAPQPRQRLAFLLWPDSTERQARTNLRHVLHTLRHALPEADRFLDVGPRTLQWRADAPLRLDVAAFEDALARAARAEGDDRLEALREAVDMYAGDLLAASYDEWLLEERERLHHSYLEALERLAGTLEERGGHAEAIPYAERLLRHDPLREETYQLVMRLHDARGDRARALRTFHACTAILERELGVEPSVRTREVYEALLPIGEEGRVEEEEGVPPGSPVLVGRALERTALTELWRGSASGRAQLVLVRGEPGIGKTRLIEEFRSSCAHRGAVTAEARSYAAEGALAYGPVVAWLRSEPLAARRGRVDAARLSELARLLPELSDAPGVLRPQALPESEQRQRLSDTLVHALLPPGVPVLLVADDLQWADQETLQFLHYLLRAQSEAPLLVAATARDEEAGDQQALTELVSGLQALERFTEIRLDRLSREETGVLAERFAGRGLQDEEADQLFAETEGNPLFVVEALRAGWVGDENVRGPLSPRVQAVIEARLAQLSGEAHHLVGVAATVGREFTTDVLAEASEADEAAFVRGLDELWRRRIVRDRGPDSYDFSHDRIREVAYLALSPPARRRTHLLVAGALERVHGTNDASVSGQLAVHYDQAGAAEQAVAWYERAAEAAQELHAHAEAVRLLERALHLLGTLPGDERRDTGELALVTAALSPLAIVQGYSSSRLAEVQERGLELARELQVEPEPSLLRSIALAGLSNGDLDASGRFGKALRSRGEREGDDVLLVESGYVLGVSAFWQGKLQAARRHFESAVNGYRPEHRTTHLVRYGLDPKVVCLSRLGNTLWFLGRPEAATRARESALALAAEIGHRVSETTALVFAAYLAVELGDLDDVRRHTAALDASSRLADAKVMDTTLEALAGYLDVSDGSHEDGLARIGRALDESRESPHAPGLHASVVRVFLEACETAVAPERGLAVADAWLAGGMGSTRLWEAEARRLRASLLAALGAPRDELETELARALDVARRQRAKSLELRVATSLLGLRLESGDDRKSRAARELLGSVLGTLPERTETADRLEAEAMLDRR